MRGWQLIAGLSFMGTLAACAESLVDPVPPSEALTIRDQTPRPAMAEPAVVTDHFWQAAATDFRRSPGVPRQTISLGFIGDGPVGLEPGPHEGPWWRPFRREWSSRYYGGAGWGGQPYGVYASGY